MRHQLPASDHPCCSCLSGSRQGIQHSWASAHRGEGGAPGRRRQRACRWASGHHHGSWAQPPSPRPHGHQSRAGDAAHSALPCQTHGCCTHVRCSHSNSALHHRRWHTREPRARAAQLKVHTWHCSKQMAAVKQPLLSSVDQEAIGATGAQQEGKSSQCVNVGQHRAG